MKEFKCGTVSIIGKPNTGKSTLINALTGKKISAVSDKPNTTRNKILGVYNSEDCQIIFLDTPGIQKSSKFLNRIMVQSSYQAIGESDIVLVIVDGSRKSTFNTDEIASKIVDKKPVIAINKIDLIKKSKILSILNVLTDQFPIAESFVPISALEEEGLDILIEEFKKALPVGKKIRFLITYGLDQSLQVWHRIVGSGESLYSRVSIFVEKINAINPVIVVSWSNYIDIIIN